MDPFKPQAHQSMDASRRNSPKLGFRMGLFFTNYNQHYITLNDNLLYLLIQKMLTIA